MDWITLIIAPLAIVIAVVSLIANRSMYRRSCERRGEKPLNLWQIITYRPGRRP